MESAEVQGNMHPVHVTAPQDACVPCTSALQALQLPLLQYRSGAYASSTQGHACDCLQNHACFSVLSVSAASCTFVILWHGITTIGQHAPCAWCSTSDTLCIGI